MLSVATPAPKADQNPLNHSIARGFYAMRVVLGTYANYAQAHIFAAFSLASAAQTAIFAAIAQEAQASTFKPIGGLHVPP